MKTDRTAGLQFHRDVSYELELSRSLLRATLESTADGILIVDLEGRIAEFNTRFLELWAVPTEVMDVRDEKRVFEHVRTALVDPAAFPSNVNALPAGLKDNSFELLPLRDGRFVECRSRPQQLGERAVGRVWSFRDVTEQKRAESRCKRLFDSPLIGLLLSDDHGHIVDANDAFLKMVGYSREDLMAGRINYMEMTPPEFQEVTRRAIREVQERGVASTFEKEYVRKDGRRVPVLLGSVRIPEQDQNATFVLNLSDRKASEAEREELINQLVSKRSILQAVLQHLPHAVFIAEAPSGKMLLVNEEAKAQLHLTSFSAQSIEEYRSRGCQGFHPDGRPYDVHEWPLARAITHGEVVQNEPVEIRWTDGSLATIEYSATPVRNAHGRITHGVVVGVDVTCKKVAEKERERLLEELKLAVSARDEFLSVASHELKTPLTPLSLKLEILARTAVVEDGRLAPHVEIMRRQVKRLTSLVSDLLDVSSIRSGRLGLTLRPQEVDLGELVHDVASRFDAEAKRVGCEMRIHAPTPVRGVWDYSRLEQVLTNMLANSLKYGAGRPVTLTVQASDGRASVSVRDQGIGIAPENLQRIWGKFERAVSQRHYGGLGLGLYISRQIVQALGGTVKAESTLGRGSTFTMELPLDATLAPRVCSSS